MDVQYEQWTDGYTVPRIGDRHGINLDPDPRPGQESEGRKRVCQGKEVFCGREIEIQTG